MAHSVYFTLVTLSIAATWGLPTDQGPQTFQEIKPQQKYQEVIMYLTPTQIRALEQGQRLDERAVLAQNPQFQAGFVQSVQQYQNEQFRQRLEQQQKNIQNLLQELANQQSQLQAVKNYTELRSADLSSRQQSNEIQYPLPRYNHEQYKQLAEQLLISSQQDENKQYFKAEIAPVPNQLIFEGNYLNNLDTKQPLIKQELPESPVKALFNPTQEFVKLVQGVPPQNQAHFVFDPLLEQKFQLIPYEYIAEQQREHQKLGKKLLLENQGQMFTDQTNEQGVLQKQQEQQINKQFEQQLNKQLEQQLNQQKVEQIEQQQIKKEQEKVTHLDLIKEQQDLKFQYAPGFNDHRYTSDIQNLLKSLHFDNKKSKAAAEAIASSPPIVIHKDITIKKHHPNVIIKSVNVPVPAPFLVPYPQPYEVKYPQPYAVPYEVIKPYPVPIVKTEKIEVEKPVPIQVEKRVPVEVERKVYVKVNKPYTVERIVPFELKRQIPVEVPLYKPEKLTILRHIWQH